MDAVRIKDGEFVVIKQYSKSTHPHESDIALYLSSPELSQDPRNRCCPILDVLDVPDEADTRLLVMPMLRRYNRPAFATVGEAVEFCRQTFEVSIVRQSSSAGTHYPLQGLQFMHEHRVAHRSVL